MAATNRPQDLDEAALRRLTRRIYLPLPDDPARRAIIEYKLKDANKNLSEEDMNTVVAETAGYSCADLNFVVKEAAMIPMRELSTEELMKLKDVTEIRPIGLQDFRTSLQAN